MQSVGLVERSTVERLAEQARRLSGSTDDLSPKEALALLEAVTPGSEESQTYILVTEDGEEIPAVLVDEEVVFTATENDIRAGTIAATAKGVTEGTKVIPSYIVTEGYKIISKGKTYSISFDDEMYDFTKLQAIICPYTGSIAGSVTAEKVVIDDCVYAVNSSEAMATVERDAENKSINLGIVNDSGVMSLLRYFTYKEIY